MDRSGAGNGGKKRRAARLWSSVIPRMIDDQILRSLTRQEQIHFARQNHVLFKIITLLVR